MMANEIENNSNSYHRVLVSVQHSKQPNREQLITSSFFCCFQQRDKNKNNVALKCSLHLAISRQFGIFCPSCSHAADADALSSTVA